MSEMEHGIEPHSVAAIRNLCEQTPGIRALWLFGSRARGDHRARSDIDLAVDAPDWAVHEVVAFEQALKCLPMVYPVDCAWWQDSLTPEFRERIERDRQVLWAPRQPDFAQPVSTGVEFKRFQEAVLTQLQRYLDALLPHAKQAEVARQALRAMEGREDLKREAADYPKEAWKQLKDAGHLPVRYADHAHSSRFDGAGRAIPNVCLKVPTGGGKTLLATSSVSSVFSHWFKRHTGLVLWVVPNDAIYRQTLKTLSDRDHPYRQILNVAGAGRVKILEKTSPLTRLDVDSHLCVMVLMLASAARQSKETLRFFRDRGNVLGFLPREDDIEAHWQLLQQVPNLDVYTPFGQSQEGARAQKGSIVKSSLGNVMRMVRPMVVIDEGHHGYSENAFKTLDGFNPGFLLELSATPRVSSAKGSGSNILVDVRGTDLDEAQMIKLPIHVDVQHWSDWQSCLAASVHRLDSLQLEAQALQGETSRYIRPILLVQVERTGADLRDAGYIHAEDARDYLLQLGFTPRQIAIKTSEKDDLKQPENINLLAPICEVRVIITKQALQEGWDCPFAYVLCALAAGRNPGAMTQLVGRILRQPHVTKTGREALDACYVLCHDAKTADVVKAIKNSLEGEGMGDLAMTVSGGDASSAQEKKVKLTRRAAMSSVRLFLPRVTVVDATQRRRELVYDSDVLAYVNWADLRVDALAAMWAPNSETPLGERFDIDLSILSRSTLTDAPSHLAQQGRLDRSRLVRALLDIAPNAWLVWDWVNAVVDRLLAKGLDEGAMAASSASLIERLRVDLEAERDRLAQAVFEVGVASGRIEFALRADATDYELPHELTLDLTGEPELLKRTDARPVAKSLLEPALKTPDMNDFEAQFAGYLDGKQAVQWWHRNVAKTQYGLQGWRRHKVYPDFVFGLIQQEGLSKAVIMETKGLHLAQSDDSHYKRAVLARLSHAFKDERWRQVGQLELTGASRQELVCDLLMDQSWQGTLEAQYFSE
ncbi:MAG: DEAD/DEAH box helicase family protein [Burkholderiales bacterium]|nr:DEAD/DEAH box helicase family protein [Burkholderiales bacterium]